MLDKTDRQTDRQTNRQTNILAKNCKFWQVMKVITYTLIFILSGKCQITQPFTPAETLASDQEAHRLGFFAHNQIH